MEKLNAMQDSFSTDYEAWLIAYRAKGPRFRRVRRRNVGKARAYGRHYYQNHKAIFSIRAIAREHLKRGLVGDLTAQDWMNALQYFDRHCAYCGATGHLEKEHVIPVTAGGGFTRSNIVPACRSCNQSKKARLLHEWFKYSAAYSDARLLHLVGWIFGESGVREVRERFGLP